MQQATVNLFADMGVQPLTTPGRADHRGGVDGHAGPDFRDYLPEQRRERRQPTRLSPSGNRVGQRRRSRWRR